jgi:hypothetical protein
MPRSKTDAATIGGLLFSTRCTTLRDAAEQDLEITLHSGIHGEPGDVLGGRRGVEGAGGTEAAKVAAKRGDQAVLDGTLIVEADLELSGVDLEEEERERELAHRERVAEGGEQRPTQCLRAYRPPVDEEAHGTT